MLTTVLVTDLVGSTEHVQRLGDARWTELLDEHNGVVRTELVRFAGEELDTAGDGFLASFDGPARAIRCALGIREALRPLGLDLRAGVHTGEVERPQGEKPRGIAVHVGARIASAASLGEILVSSTTHDLVAGPGSISRIAGSTSSRASRAPEAVRSTVGGRRARILGPCFRPFCSTSTSPSSGRAPSSRRGRARRRAARTLARSRSPRGGAPRRPPRPACSDIRSSSTTRSCGSRSRKRSSLAWAAMTSTSRACAADIVREWERHENFFLYEDALPALEALRSHGLRIGLVSNGQRDLDEFARHHGLDVDVCMGSVRHGRIKPHRSIFEAALRELGVSVDEAAMVGDSYADDIEGARALGMRAILLGSPGAARR